MFSTLSNILHQDLDPDPVLALLGTAGRDDMPLTRVESWVPAYFTVHILGPNKAFLCVLALIRTLCGH